MIPFAFLAAFALGGFEVTTIPLPTPDSIVIMAQTHRAESPALFVLHDHKLFRHEPGGAQMAITLPPRTGAVDIADSDGDGVSEVIVITRESVMRHPLQGDEPFVDMFPFQVGGIEPAAPFPQPMVFPYEGAIALALPADDGVELRTPSGDLLAAFPYTQDKGQLEPPLTVWPVTPPRISAPDGMELRVVRSWRMTVEAPLDVPTCPPGHPVEQRRVPPAQLRNMASQPTIAWPWFALQPGSGSPSRVSYAPAPPECRNTLIRIHITPPGESVDPDNPIQSRPARPYPGLLISPAQEPPDFNGDGYADLALWSSPTPTLSPSTLSKAISGMSWPVRIAFHPYLPVKGRHASLNTGMIALDLPLSWVLVMEEGSPLRHALFTDWDRDGSTDCAWAISPTKYGVWLSHDGSFQSPPDYTLNTSEPILKIERLCDQTEAVQTSAVFRGKLTLWWLRWNGSPT